MMGERTGGARGALSATMAMPSLRPSHARSDARPIANALHLPIPAPASLRVKLIRSLSAAPYAWRTSVLPTSILIWVVRRDKGLAASPHSLRPLPELL